MRSTGPLPTGPACSEARAVATLFVVRERVGRSCTNRTSAQKSATVTHFPPITCKTPASATIAAFAATSTATTSSLPATGTIVREHCRLMDKQGERERHAAAAWVGAHLGSPRIAAELTRAVEQLLEQRFDGHWYPSEPDRGSAYRVMKTDLADLDPLLARAAVSAGVSPSALHAALLTRFPRTAEGDRAPGALYLWVNPGEVKALHPDRRSHNMGKENVFGEPPPYTSSCALRLRIERTQSHPSLAFDSDAMSEDSFRSSISSTDEYSDS